MSGNVRLRNDQTFYVQYPNYFSFTLAVLVVLTLVASRRRKKLDSA